MMFVRFSVDPHRDLKRGFSGVANCWVDSKDEIAGAVAEIEREHGMGPGTLVNQLPPPRQDPTSGAWCWQPEKGLSGFAIENLAGLPTALSRVEGYGSAGQPFSVFESHDFDLGVGSDGEDLFRGGRFLGYLQWVADMGSLHRSGPAWHQPEIRIARDNPPEIGWMVRMGRLDLYAGWPVASSLHMLQSPKAAISAHQRRAGAAPSVAIS